MANLFTKGSHHRNVSVAFVVQNLFHKNKHIRTISLNAHYVVLFKNPCNASQFASLACQMYLNKSAFTVEAYKDECPTVICSSTSDRNRTKTSDCARTYSLVKLAMSTCQKNECARQKVLAGAEAHMEDGRQGKERVHS